MSSLKGKTRRRREEEQIIALGGKVSWFSFHHFSFSPSLSPASQEPEDALSSLPEEDEGTAQEGEEREEKCKKKPP